MSRYSETITVDMPDPTLVLSNNESGPLHSVLLTAVRDFPDRSFLLDETDLWSYKEVDVFTNQLARLLHDRGACRGSVVPVYAERSALFVICWLAVFKAGGVPIVLDSAYPAIYLKNVLEQVRPVIAIDLRRASEKAVESEKEGFHSESDPIASIRLPRDVYKKKVLAEMLDGINGDNISLDIRDNELAYIATTSGTTGRAKLIAAPHRPVNHFIEWYVGEMAFDANSRFSLMSGLSHDPIFREVFTSIAVGGTLCVPPQEYIRNPEKLIPWLKNHAVSVVHASPAMINIISSLAAENDLPDVRHIVSGGDALRWDEVRAMKKIAQNARFACFYGATETPQGVGYYRVSEEEIWTRNENGRIPIGRGIEGVQLLVIKDGDRLCGIGEVGEICVRSHYLAAGYLNDESLTSARFTTNPFTGIKDDRIYRTGDIGTYNDRGQVEFIGRTDRQIKIRGYRVELEEIEKEIRSSNVVKQVFLEVDEASFSDKKIIAYLIFSTSEVGCKARLEAYLAGKLPGHMIPTLVAIDKISLTPNGKIDKSAFPKSSQADRSDSWQEYKRAGGKRETLVNVWRDVLGVDDVGLTESFFDLGGNSVLAAKLLQRIKSDISGEVSLIDIFTYSTIAEFEKYLHSRDIDNHKNKQAIEDRVARRNRRFNTIRRKSKAVTNESV